MSTSLSDFNFKGSSGVKGRDIRIKGSKPAKMDHTKPQGYSNERCEYGSKTTRMGFKGGLGKRWLVGGGWAKSVPKWTTQSHRGILGVYI